MSDYPFQAKRRALSSFFWNPNSLTVVAIWRKREGWVKSPRIPLSDAYVQAAKDSGIGMVEVELELPDGKVVQKKMSIAFLLEDPDFNN